MIKEDLVKEMIKEIESYKSTVEKMHSQGIMSTRSMTDRNLVSDSKIEVLNDLLYRS